MAGFRAYYEDLRQARIGDTLRLSSDESRHLCGSLRAKDSDILAIFDLNGNAFEARMQKASAKSAEIVLLERIEIPQPKKRVTIAQCLPKGGTFETIIAQSVQLGITGIYPLISERTVVRLDQKEVQKKHAKWTQNVVEAVKQSANMAALELASISTLDTFLQNIPANSLKIVASLERDKSRPLLEIFNNAGVGFDEICILIGPEGDLSAREYSAAYEAGFIAADLGANVMKSEVAAAFCAAVAGAFLTGGFRA